jgi:hypothetical protein
MARIDWLDPETDLPARDAHVEQLDHFVDAMADGVIDANELATQESAVVAAMKATQPLLDDAQHAAVTHLLMEMTAYNVMRVFHDLGAARVRNAFGEQDEA